MNKTCKTSTQGEFTLFTSQLQNYYVVKLVLSCPWAFLSCPECEVCLHSISVFVTCFRYELEERRKEKSSQTLRDVILQDQGENKKTKKQNSEVVLGRIDSQSLFVSKQMQKACKAFAGSNITGQCQVMFRDTSFHG